MWGGWRIRVRGGRSSCSESGQLKCGFPLEPAVWNRPASTTASFKRPIITHPSVFSATVDSHKVRKVAPPSDSFNYYYFNPPPPHGLPGTIRDHPSAPVTTHSPLECPSWRRHGNEGDGDREASETNSFLAFGSSVSLLGTSVTYRERRAALTFHSVFPVFNSFTAIGRKATKSVELLQV